METTLPKKGLKKNRRTSRMCQWAMFTVTAYWIIFGLIVSMCSCESYKPVVEQEGMILAQEGDTYLCLFKELSGKPHTYTYMWVYQPGLGLIKTDSLRVTITISPKKP